MTSPSDSATPAPEPLALVLPDSGEIEPLVLAQKNWFVVTNRRGDIAPAGARDLGLFALDVRHLSRYELRVIGQAPICLSSDTVDAAFSQVDLTLSDREFEGLVDDPQNFLHIRRKQILDQELVDEIVLTNHLRRRVEVALEILVASDFADVFEVRGARRPRRGQMLPPVVTKDRIELSYRGRDQTLYRTVVRFLPAPAELYPGGARFRLALDPGETLVQEVAVAALREREQAPERRPFDQRLRAARADTEEFVSTAARWRCDEPVLDAALARALNDIGSLRVELDGRRIVAAGIPWYAAPFGRDSIVTGLETLCVAPDIARDVLTLLAAHQGREDNPERDEEPGKIMHELRRGEMARAGEIPHSPYYGSVDATPLYCVLAAETYRWTGDTDLLQQVFPAAERALGWVVRGLAAGGGVLRYQRRTPRGLESQCWKDSRDGVSFPDGTRAAPPIAVLEAQGYAVSALEEMAALYRLQGEPGRRRAAELDAEARLLRRRIDGMFWVPETGYYALALDGEGRQVSTLSSNPGHLLWARAVSERRAHRVAEVLLSDAMFSGYGIRTVARGQPVYNPLSYHNGTVWPHDNALCALGMARYGMRAQPIQVLTSLLAAAEHFRYHRLPELFCGMGRKSGEFLVHYPVSCSPQAWAAGSLFMMLEAILGLEPDARGGRLRVRNPQLPPSVRRLEVTGLQLGDAKVSLRFLRDNARCHVDLLDISGGHARVQIDLE
jgi:glycogen debranching enzyme